MITTVRLPTLMPDATIRDAVQRMTQGRSSAVVVLDTRGPVVISDRSLLNTLTTAGEGDRLKLSQITARAFSSEGFMGLLGTRTVLAEAQRKYIVREVLDDTALVDADADAAEELARPSRIRFPPPAAAN
jgi:CBS domain-containing protein